MILQNYKTFRSLDKKEKKKCKWRSNCKKATAPGGGGSGGRCRRGVILAGCDLTHQKTVPHMADGHPLRRVISWTVTLYNSSKDNIFFEKLFSGQFLLLILGRPRQVCPWKGIKWFQAGGGVRTLSRVFTSSSRETKKKRGKVLWKEKYPGQGE